MLVTDCLYLYLCVYMNAMSYHLLSWILVFARISVISRNDSSFVCFTFFTYSFLAFCYSRCHYFVADVIDRHSISFPVYCVFNWDNLMHLLFNDFRHNGLTEQKKNRFLHEETKAFSQHCNLLISICSLKIQDQKKMWEFTFIISPIKCAHSPSFIVWG